MILTELISDHHHVPRSSFRNALLLAAWLGLTACAATQTHAASPPSGVAGLLPSGFGVDGDLLANTPLLDFGDWMSSTNHPGAGQPVLDQNGVPLNPVMTFHFVDPFNNNDSVFTGGSKWTDDPNSWSWTTSRASSKTDINNVLLHLAYDSSGHIWTAIAGDRRSTGGDSYIDFEFLQNTLVRNTNGSFTSSGPHDGRTVHDLLLSLAFGGGGEVAHFFAWQWRTNAAGGHAYVDVTDSLPADRIFAALNSNNIAVPYGAFGQTNYIPFAFAESALDLTALLGNFDPCQSFGFKTIMVKTKASQSGSATIEDFVEPIQYNLKIGPSASAGPDQTRCTEGDVTVFPLQGSATAGLRPLASNYWTVVSGSATVDAPASLLTTARVSSAAATVRLTVVQTDGCVESSDIILRVAPLPDCSITGPGVLCPEANAPYEGPAGMDNYAWSISGNGSITGPTDERTVNVIAGGICRSNFVLSLTVTSNGCSRTCWTTVLLNDTNPPTIVCTSNRNVAELPRDSGAALVTFEAATATDDCDSNPAITSDPVSGSFFPVGANTVTATATDSCGNSNSCSFVVRVIPYRLRVTSTDDSGAGTLRQALLDGNDSPDENLVIFDLPGAGPHRIDVHSPLPQITSPVIVDGSNAAPAIELAGPGGSNAFDGLVITCGNSVIRGLALHGFATAIRLQTNGQNVIQGNFIGTDSTGTNALGNSGHGIYIESSQNLVGGTTSGAGNRIAFNGLNAITVAGAAIGNGLLGNSILSNTNLGIDLGDDGITGNDPDDSDPGPNGLQNFPVLSDATSIDGITTVEGELTAASNTVYRLEFFLNDFADPSGNGEGQTFLGSTTLLLGETGSETFSMSFPLTAKHTQFITATATGPGNNTSEFSPAVPVRTPPVIEIQPIGTNAGPGDSVLLCAEVSGTPPLYFQWRLNGVNIPGATNTCLAIPSAQIAQGGTYTLCVGNELGAVASISAGLTLRLPRIAPGDNFADRVPVTGTNGVLAASNKGATLEPGEPLHAGKPGGSSVWYTWTAPITGVASFRTPGSTFDTLLAIYKGSSLTNLEPVESDEDRGGFYTSKAIFNAFRDTQYQIAVDGFGGGSGEFVLAWEEEDTSHLIPLFTLHPSSQTVTRGGTAFFQAMAVSVCGNGHVDCVDPGHYPDGELPKLDLQWLFNGAPIAGATTNTLLISDVQPEQLGIYTLQVSTRWHTIESRDASLQINLTGSEAQEVLALDKLLDSDLSILYIGVPPPDTANKGRDFKPLAASVVRGYTGTQIFSTAGSATGPGELICGVVGGASSWITFVAEATGNLFLDTQGSTYDTVMAVFRRSPTNAAVLELLGCNNNVSSGNNSSALALPVEAGKTNYILVDGVNGATGILQLNYSLVTTTVLKSLGKTELGAERLQVNGRSNLNFTIQCSTNLLQWTSLITTNAPTGVFEYVDPSSINSSRRFYRAILLP